jgi:hypothetical protein
LICHHAVLVRLCFLKRGTILLALNRRRHRIWSRGKKIHAWFGSLWIRRCRRSHFFFHLLASLISPGPALLQTGMPFTRPRAERRPSFLEKLGSANSNAEGFSFACLARRGMCMIRFCRSRRFQTPRTPGCHPSVT